MIGELVVVVEGGARVCKELVVSFPFTLSFCSSFLLFGLWGWVCLVSEGSHVVEGDVVGSDGRAENVQWGTMFGVKGGWRVLVRISAVLLAEDTPPILIPPST